MKSRMMIWNSIVESLDAGTIVVYVTTSVCVLRMNENDRDIEKHRVDNQAQVQWKAITMEELHVKLRYDDT